MRNYLLGILALSALAAAQDAPDANAILNSSATAMKTRGYRVELHMSLEIMSPAPGHTFDVTGQVLFQPPNKSRLEMTVAGAGGGEVRMVSNGVDAWTYMSDSKTYMRDDPGKPQPGLGLLAGADMAANVGSVERQADQSVVVDGQTVDCYVLLVKYKPAHDGASHSATLSVDKTAYRVLHFRDSEGTERADGTSRMHSVADVSITSFTWDPPFAGNEFEFKPPEGATEIHRPAPPRAEPATVPLPPPPTTPHRIRVGGNVQAANLIRKVDPVYPELAKAARVQGTVRFTAIIGKDGTILSLQLISGHPLLVPSATDAVKQWVYRPTLLNGQPVEVVTQVDVNFTLDP